MDIRTMSAPALLLLQAAGDGGQIYLTVTLAISVLSLGMAVFFAKYVLAQDNGTPAMQKISNAIKAGAEAFLRRQNQTIVVLAVVSAIIVFAAYSFGTGDNGLASRMTISFVTGAACSLAAGFSGMWVSIRTNIRTASAARTSLNKALQIALRGVSAAQLLKCACTPSFSRHCLSLPADWPFSKRPPIRTSRCWEIPPPQKAESIFLSHSTA